MQRRWPFEERPCISEEATLWEEKKLTHRRGHQPNRSRSRADQYAAHLGGELSLYLLPMALDVLPGRIAGCGYLQGLWQT